MWTYINFSWPGTNLTYPFVTDGIDFPYNVSILDLNTLNFPEYFIYEWNFALTKISNSLNPYNGDGSTRFVDCSVKGKIIFFVFFFNYIDYQNKCPASNEINLAQNNFSIVVSLIKVTFLHVYQTRTWKVCVLPNLGACLKYLICVFFGTWYAKLKGYAVSHACPKNEICVFPISLKHYWIVHI